MGRTINHSIKVNFPELKVTIKADFSQKEQQITLLQVTKGAENEISLIFKFLQRVMRKNTLKHGE